MLVAYIDQNPVGARLVRSPCAYPYGSAWHYARPAGPRWLSRTWVEEVVRAAAGRAEYRPHDYAGAFGRAARGAVEHFVEARCAASDDADPLDDLVVASPAAVGRWMRRKALLADGTRPGLPVVPLGWLERLAASRPSEE